MNDRTPTPVASNGLRRVVDRLAREEEPLAFVASRLLWASRLSRLITFPMPDGYRLRFYPSAVSVALWRNRDFRPRDSGLLRRYLRPGDTFVDVGANIGHLSLLAATRIAPGGRVVAIEPHPRTCRFLAGNVALNGAVLARVIEVRNVAIGARPGTVAFTSLRSDDQNRPLPAGEARAQGRLVPVTTLDGLLGEHAIDLLKVDTEGFELEVLAGAPTTLRRCAALYIEDSDRNLRRYGGSSPRLRRALRDAGFAPFRIARGRPVATAVDPDEPCAGAENLFAVRDDRIDELLNRAGLTRACA